MAPDKTDGLSLVFLQWAGLAAWLLVQRHFVRRIERSNERLAAEYRRAHFPASRERVDLDNPELFL